MSEISSGKIQDNQLNQEEKIKQKSILELFLLFYDTDKELRELIGKYAKQRPDYKPELNKDVKTEMKKSDFFITVERHLRKYKLTNDISYLKKYRTGASGYLKELALRYIELLPKKEERLNEIENSRIKRDTENNIHEVILEKEKSLEEAENSSLNKNFTKDITIVYRWNDLEQFIGRESEKQDLKNKLDTSRNAVITGIRGIGKTSLIQHYLNENSQNYNHIIWITVIEEFKQSFIDTMLTSTHFKTSFLVSIENLSKFEKIKKLLAKFSALKGDNLMIIDNAGSSIEIQDTMNLLSILNNSWKFIFSSNHEIAYPEPIELKEMSEKEAFVLFQSFYFSNGVRNHEKNQARDTFTNHPDKIKTLLENINYHPLLIELIAKVDIEDSLLTLKGLTEIINDLSALKSPCIDRAISPRNKNINCEDIPVEEITPYNYIKAIFYKDLIKLTEIKKKVLLYFALLPSMSIPIADIDIMFGIPNDELRKTLHNLKGWIKFDDNSKGYSMAVLYQFAIREILNPSETDVKEFHQQILSIYNHEINAQNKIEFSFYPQYLSAIEKFLK